MINIPERYNKEDTPTYKILQAIKAGSLDAKSLSKEERQACVEVLILEGYEVASIAQLLDRSEKTIKRDKQEIWQRNSQMPTPEFVLREITEMINKGKVHQSYLMRLARSKDTPPKERIEAERSAWQVGNEIAERLQTLGFLPTKPQEVINNLYHHKVDTEATISELKKKVIELTKIANETEIYDEDIKKRIEHIKGEIKKLEIVKEVDDLSKDIENAQKKGDDRSEE